jgi:hypothetical protein
MAPERETDGVLLLGVCPLSLLTIKLDTFTGSKLARVN